MSSPAATDVIIVNYRGVADTLAAVAALQPLESGHIWVVDNSNDKAEAALLRESLEPFRETTLLVPEANLGFGEGCNLAYAQSRAEFVLLLNPDARIAPDQLALLAGALQAAPHLGAVVPAIYWDEDFRFLLPGLLPQTPLNWFAMAVATHWPQWLGKAWTRFQIGRQQKMHAASHAQDVSFVSGGVLLVRRTAIQKAGGLFDPRFFMFYEDADLSQRLRACGYGMALVPNARAVHHWKEKPEKAAPMAQSAPVYVQRHYPGLARLARLWSAPAGAPFAPLAAAQPAHAYGRALASGPLRTLEAFHAALEGKLVLAICPSLLGYPAIFRPRGEPPVQLSPADWQRLGAGFYLVLAQHGAAGHVERLVFEKAD